MKTITITAMERPELFKKLLDTLVLNDLSDWKIKVSLDPSDHTQAFFEICSQVLAGYSYSVTVNQTRLGVRGHPFKLLTDAYENDSELVLYLEEDIIISPDTTELASWFDNNYKSHWFALNLLCGPCGTAGYLSSPWFPDTILETRLFNSLGFAMRRTTWEEHVRQIWMGADLEETPRPANWATRWGWDWTVYAYLLSSPTLKVLQPVFSRVNHMGEHGYHVRPDLNKKMFGALEINMLRRMQYGLQHVTDMPHEIQSHINALDELGAMKQQLAALDREVLLRERSA